MAEPAYNAVTGLQFQVIEQASDPPPVTDPKVVNLEFQGAALVSGIPTLVWTDDTGQQWAVPAFLLPDVFTSSAPFSPAYMQDGLLAPASDIELEPGSEVVRFIRGFQIGKESAGTRNVKWYTGNLGGSTTFQPPGPNDGIDYDYIWPATRPTVNGQRLETTTAGVFSWAGPGEPPLASDVSVDLNITTKQVLYTVPAGKVCYITKVIFRDPSGSVTVAKAPFGFNANADNVLPTQDLSPMTGGTIYQQFVVSSGTEGAAADTFGTKLTTAQGSAMTCKADVFGYLV